MLCGHVLGLRMSKDALSVDITADKIQKLSSVDNQSTRVLFFAGIEGAGHHFMEHVLQDIPHKEVRLPHTWQCRPEGSIWMKSDTATMKETLRGLSVSTLWTFPPLLSYPCHGSSNVTGRRAHLPFHPRLDWIREAAAAANVDLRVILVFRPVADTLAADCIHRDFDNCSAQADILNFNGRALVDHLRSVPRSALSCFPYGDQARMRESLRNSMNDTRDLLGTAWADHVEQDSRDTVPDWANLVRSLEPLEHDLWTLCESARA